MATLSTLARLFGLARSAAEAAPPREPAGDASSATDVPLYRAACRRAAQDDDAFARFRSHPALLDAMEHVARDYAAALIGSALARRPDYRAMLPAFLRNDDFGRPPRARFAGIGKAAPTTLRYIKFLADIEDLFGPLDGLHVVEIGAGYGGQAAVIRTRFAVASYTIVDLPEPGALARRFLAARGWPDTRACAPDEPVPHAPADLVISNYAFSELRESVQQRYIAAILRDAARGFLLYNDRTIADVTARNTGERPLSAEQAAALIPGARIERDAPFILDDDRRIGNVLVWWDRTRG